MITLEELISSGVPYCGKYDVPITANFSLKEFMRNNHGIKVCAGVNDMRNIRDLTDNVLQPLRDLIQEPINIVSGLRSVQLNNIVKGVPNSQHLTGQAADITSRHILAMWHSLLVKIEFDQAILYIDDNNNITFIHVSFNFRDNRNQKLLCQHTPFGKKYSKFSSKVFSDLRRFDPR